MFRHGDSVRNSYVFFSLGGLIMFDFIMEIEKKYQEKEKKAAVSAADKNFFRQIAMKDVMKILNSEKPASSSQLQ